MARGDAAVELGVLGALEVRVDGRAVELPVAKAFREEFLGARAHHYGNYYFEGLLGMAALAAAGGDDVRAATLEAAATTLRDRPVYEPERPVYDHVVERFIKPARERLGPEAWASAAAAGRALGTREALALALGESAVGAVLSD